MEDEAVFLASSSRKNKVFRLQKLRFYDGQGFDNGRIVYRLCYYMIAQKPRMKGRWAFGQFAPMMTPEDLNLVIVEATKKGWLRSSRAS